MVAGAAPGLSLATIPGYAHPQQMRAPPGYGPPHGGGYLPAGAGFAPGTHFLMPPPGAFVAPQQISGGPHGGHPQYILAPPGFHPPQGSAVTYPQGSAVTYPPGSAPGADGMHPGMPGMPPGVHLMQMHPGMVPHPHMLPGGYHPPPGMVFGPPGSLPPPGFAPAAAPAPPQHAIPTAEATIASASPAEMAGAPSPGYPPPGYPVLSMTAPPPHSGFAPAPALKRPAEDYAPAPTPFLQGADAPHSATSSPGGPAAKKARGPTESSALDLLGDVATLLDAPAAPAPPPPPIELVPVVAALG